MHDSPRRARQQELARAQRSNSAIRRGLHTVVLAVIAGGTLAFAGIVSPVAEDLPGNLTASATATAFGAAELPKIDRGEARLVASRFESRAPIPGVVVELVVDGEASELTTTAATVGELLAEVGVLVDNDDVVSVPLSTRVEAGLSVTVTTVGTSSEQVTETDEFETIEELDGTMLRGEREVITEGVDGVTATTFQVTTEGGQEASRVVVARAIRSERVDEVVRVGTAVPAVPVVRAPRPAAPASSDASASSSAASTAGAAGNYSPGSSKAIAADMVAARGWGQDQFQCLEQLWQRESNWNHLAQNPSSGAYGIPQSLPGSKMASAGADWQTNPATQITWGLGYISGRYGTPCGALSHSHARGWY